MTHGRADCTCRCLDLYIVNGLHKAGGGHEEGAVADPPGGGDDLAPTPVQGLPRNAGIQDLELHIPDGLITQGPFPGAPLEALNMAKAVSSALVVH